jgi:hypothetical protein
MRDEHRLFAGISTSSKKRSHGSYGGAKQWYA